MQRPSLTPLPEERNHVIFPSMAFPSGALAARRGGTNEDNRQEHLSESSSEEEYAEGESEESYHRPPPRISEGDAEDDDSEASEPGYSDEEDIAAFQDDNGEPDYSDNEDLVAFASHRCWTKYRSDIKPIKHNDSRVKSLDLRRTNFPSLAWARVGLYLSQNMHVSRLNVCESGLTAENMDALFGKLHGNQSYDEVILSGNPFGLGGMRSLAPCLFRNSNLKNLQINDVGLGSDGAALLSSALFGTALEKIGLGGNGIGDDGLKKIIPFLSSPGLIDLNLSYNGIGVQGCVMLTRLLLVKNSSLQALHLNGNCLDDSCAAMLAGALTNNTTLKRLHLDDNSEITTEGWTCFLNLVCDTSSLNSTYLSNHTLIDIGDTIEYKCWDDGTVEKRLRSALKFNFLQRACYCNDVADIAHEKVLFFNLSGEFDLRPFLNIDIKMMPHVLSWMGRTCKLTAINRILRHWNMPSLYCNSSENIAVTKASSQFKREYELSTLPIKQITPGWITFTEGNYATVGYSGVFAESEELFHQVACPLKKKPRNALW